MKHYVESAERLLFRHRVEPLTFGHLNSHGCGTHPSVTQRGTACEHRRRSTQNNLAKTQRTDGTTNTTRHNTQPQTD